MSHINPVTTDSPEGILVNIPSHRAEGEVPTHRAEGEVPSRRAGGVDPFIIDDAWFEDESDDESEPSLPEKLKQQIQANVRRQDRHKLLQTINRNVIILGRTRTGKSTFVEVLKDVTHEPPVPTLFSETKDATFKSFSLKDDDAQNVQKNYTINIVDTPGLFEVNRVSEGNERSNNFIKKCIKRCLENEIARIHCVLIFLTVNGGINAKDVEAIEIFLEDFSSSKVTACLCITHAEHFDSHRKKMVMEELLDYPRASGLIKQHDVKILFTGCVNPDFHPDGTSLTNAYKKVFRMRKKALDTIFKADDEGAHLTSLSAIKHSNKMTMMLAQECKNFLHSMTVKKQDMNLSSLKLQLDIHSSNMHMLAQDEAMFSFHPQLTPVIKDIEILLHKASTMYDSSILSRLSAPFSCPVYMGESKMGQSSSSSRRKSGNGEMRRENKLQKKGDKAHSSSPSSSSPSSSPSYSSCSFGSSASSASSSASSSTSTLSSTSW
jgi:GTP-binding protein EngB required for normal cell division